MNLEIYDYFEKVFEDKEFLKSIILNLSFTITYNQPCKDMYLIGDHKNIQNFLILLEKTLGDKIFYYSKFLETNSLSTRFCKYIIFQKGDNFRNKSVEGYSKIICGIDQLYYLSNEMIINFKNTEPEFKLDILSNELNNLISRFVNLLLQNNNLTFVNLKSNNLQLYNGFFLQNYKNLEGLEISLENLYLSISVFCKRTLSLNHLKEYLIELFGKPDYVDGWKKLKFE